MSSALKQRRPGGASLFGFSLVFIITGAGLFSRQVLNSAAPNWLQITGREIVAACRDAGTQWMVVVCLVSYFVTFVVIEKRRAHTSALRLRSPHGAKARGFSACSAFIRGRLRKPDFWLVGFLVLVLMRYVVDYPKAAKSLQVVVLMTGVVIGKAAAFYTSSALPIGAGSGARNQPDGLLFRRWVMLGCITILLALAALWHPQSGLEYFYRGVLRRTGPWENPNLFGLLMGVGGLLALGLMTQSLLRHKQQVLSAAKVPRVWILLPTAFFVMAGLCCFGLVNSYSRGAWLGTGVGFSFLALQLARHPAIGVSSNKLNTWLRRNWLPAFIFLLSVFAISFWQFRHTEHPFLRRVFSVGNVNDFSWRNRVSTWVGAVEMMKDRLLAGHGWSAAEELFNAEYKPERLADSGIVGLNDYLTIGITCGVPALAFFSLYVAGIARRVSFGRGQKDFSSNSTFTGSSGHLLATASVSGALVLAVGFWFDGGLFKLPTCVVFWVLLGLARVSFETAKLTKCANESESDASQHYTLFSSIVGKGISSEPVGGQLRSVVLPRWISVIAALIAAGLTVLHLGVPQLQVGERTLRVARKYLIQSNESTDFDFLATKPIWSGQKLKSLLQHVHLANYNRQLVNWKIDDQQYQSFVLSPEIDRGVDGNKDWRRVLWEYFYPRIRQATDISFATETIVRQLKERMRQMTTPQRAEARTISEIWKTNDLSVTPAEFEVLAVAALRSVGIPARLDKLGNAEYWNGKTWSSVKAKPSPNE